MGTSHRILKKIEKFSKRSFIFALLAMSAFLGVATYALSDTFIKTQVEYLVSVIDANVEFQKLDETGSRNVYIGMREIYRGVIAVLDERIGDSQGVSSPCDVFTDPVEKTICEVGRSGGGTGATTPGINATGSTNTGSKYSEYVFTINNLPISTSNLGGAQNGATIYVYCGNKSSNDTVAYTGTYNGQGTITIRKRNVDDCLKKGTDLFVNNVNTCGKVSPVTGSPYGIPTPTIDSISSPSSVTANGVATWQFICKDPGGLTNTGSTGMYNKYQKKVCEGATISGLNKIQNYRWYDSENKPSDIIAICSQPNRPNGGLICSESAGGCCPAGQVAINGKCITPVNAGESCYATSGCKDGLSCSNNVCVGTPSGSGTTGTGTPRVSATVTGIASTTSPGTFTNRATQGTNIQLQYSSSNVGNTLSYQIFKGTGPLDNTNLAPGTSFAQYANLVGNVSQSFNIPLQNMAIGTYRIVVTGCNSSNQCASTSPVVFEVIAAGGGSGGSGTTTTPGGTGSGTTFPSAPAGYTDISCPGGTTSTYWPCGTSSLNEYNPIGCGVDRSTQYKSESFYTSTSICNNGTSSIGVTINRNTNTVNWYCVNQTTKNSVQCKALLNVDASCGSAQDKTAPLDAYSYFQTNNTSLCKTGKLGVITPGGIEGTGIYKIENTTGTNTADINYYMNANYAYKCDGIGAGSGVTCRTGKINIIPECNTGAFSCKGGFVKKISGEAQDQYDPARFKSGELRWNCEGLENGTIKTVSCGAQAAGQNAVCGSSFFQSSAATQSLGSIQYFNANGTSISYPFNPFLLCDLPRGVPTGRALADDAGKFVVPDDIRGDDGRFDWKCKGIDRFGNPTTETSTCSARRIFPGECGTHNGATLTSVDPDSSFYQSWGEPIKLKYCAKGYPTYTDNIGSDGTFDWYCSFPDSSKTYCSASKGGSSGGTPVNGLCSSPSVKNTCLAGTVEVINNCTSNQQSTWKCKGTNGGGDSVTCSVNNTGCGGSTYTYSWSFNNSTWSVCAGSCGSGNGSQNRTAQCLRNDGVASPGMCSGVAPSETQKCSAPSNTCTPLSCDGGNMVRYSGNGTACNFSWTSIAGGNNKTVTLPDGSYAQGYCNTDGTWSEWDYLCKDAAQNTVSCTGGGRTFASADGTNSCYAEYVQKNAGESATVGNGLVITGGGVGSATCSTTGYWTFSVNCPGKVKSCPGGAGDLPAANGDPACVAYYPITEAGKWGNGTTNYAGGWIKGYCDANGEWDATSITYDCKP